MHYTEQEKALPPTVRIMTYNVHRCQGSDGICAPQRIAEVIAACRPDVVALQEVDVGRSRSGFVNQAETIARELGMDHQFFASMRVMEGFYGNAILSRLPSSLCRAGHLPQAWRAERRGVLWACVELPEGTFHLLNTHLGLRAGERDRQIATLLGDEWIGGIVEERPVILAGDFNAMPWSRSYRQITARLRDLQAAVCAHPRPTFPTSRPLFRLDHIFSNAYVEPLSSGVYQSPLSLLASDHLPLVAEVAINGGVEAGEAAGAYGTGKKLGAADEQ